MKVLSDRTKIAAAINFNQYPCLLYTSPSPRDTR